MADTSDAWAREHRLLVLVRGAREGELTRRVLLEAGLQSELCRDVEDLASKLRDGAGALLLAEEVLTPETRRPIAEELARQPAWSDVPVLVFSAARVDQARVGPGSTLGNVTYLDRPVHTRTLIASVQSALRSRGRQYEARRAIESRDAFLAMLGHELRNPLSAVALALKAVERKNDGSAQTREHGVMTRQLSHLSRLVDELLDVARVTRGKVVIERRVVDLVEVTRAAFETYELRAKEHQIDYRLTLPTTRLYVLGDRPRLEQMLNNLLTNALKYTPVGGRIELSIASVHDHVCVTVADDGVGLAPEMLDRVFEPFAQVSSSLDRSQGGLGLGLSLVKSLVGLHDGQVRAVSAGVGRGCRFEVELPRVESAPEPLEKRSPSTSPAPPLKVAVVEDNDDIRDLFVNTLRESGHVVSAAADGPQGVDLLLTFSPDIAFVDVGLPGFDGYEVARRARAAGAYTRLVAVSGYGQNEDRRRSAEAGFDEHLVKPVVDEDIQQSLKRAVGATRARSAGVVV